MDDLLQEVERALRSKRMSGHQASLEAVGNPELVKRMRRGEVPTVVRFRELCRVVGLEFYVGAPRDKAPVDERRLEVAVESAERAIEASARALSASEKARLLVAVYELIGREGTGAARMRTVLGLLGQPGRRESE